MGKLHATCVVVDYEDGLFVLSFRRLRFVGKASENLFLVVFNVACTRALSTHYNPYLVFGAWQLRVLVECNEI